MLRIQAEALTYDDVSLVPAHSTVLPKDVTLDTRLTRDLRIRLPIVSAAMDTVSEARLAIAMAQLGGISIIHKNMTAQAQAAQVDWVKTFESGVIRRPFTVGPDTSIGEVLKQQATGPLPPTPRRAGTVEVWSHLVVADGVELTLEPGRAGLTPEQVRAFFRVVTQACAQIHESGEQE